MADKSEFDSICPYNDEEAVKALGKVANHPAVFAISEYLFPDRPITYLRDALKSVRNIDEFQEKVMNDAVLWCVEHTMNEFSYSGISYIKGIKGKFLAMSNHRDIILDPAITQMVFFKNGFYGLINRISDVEFVNGASDFRTFRRNVRDAVLSLPETSRFSKGIFPWVGFETHYMPYTAADRLSGSSKWNFIKLWKYAISGIISFTTTPLRLPLVFSGITGAAAVGSAVFDKKRKDRALPAILGTGSVLLLAVGILGEYIARVFVETKHRPVYIIKEVLDNHK